MLDSSRSRVARGPKVTNHFGNLKKIKNLEHVGSAHELVGLTSGSRACGLGS